MHSSLVFDRPLKVGGAVAEGRFDFGVICCISDGLVEEKDIYVFFAAITGTFVAMIPNKVAHKTSTNAALRQAESFHQSHCVPAQRIMHQQVRDRESI